MALSKRQVQNTLIITLGLMFLSSRLWSAASTTGAAQTAPADDKFQAVKVRETQLDKLMQISGVPEQYEKCKKDPGGLEVSACIWKNLNDTQKKAVQEKMSQGKDANQKKYEGLDINTVKVDKDPGILKLEEYFHNELRKSLYGEVTADATKKGITVVDHGIFYDLYETQISKNIVEAISSYCLDADLDLKIVSDGMRETQRKKNIEMLKSFNPPPTAAPADTSSANGKKKSVGAPDINNEALNHFNKCAVGIQHVCHDTAEQDNPAVNYSYSHCTELPKSPPPNDTQKKEYDQCKEDWANSKLRACEVVNYIKSARQNLIALTAIRKDMEKKEGQGGIQLLDKKIVVTVNDGTIEGRSTDDMTTYTSRQVVEKSELAQADSEEAKKLGDRCKTNVEDVECKKFLLSADESKKLEESTTELGIRSEAMLDRIGKLKENDEEFKKYFKEQGYSDADIELQLKDKDKVVGALKSKYENEKIQLIKSLNARFTNSKKSENKDATAVALDEKGKIDRIKDDLEKKPERMAQLIHFENVIMSMLTVNDGKESKHNTASLYKELGDSCMDAKGCKSKNSTGPSPASDSANDGYIKELQKNAEGPGHLTKGTPGKAKKTFIGVDTINKSILDHDTPAKASGP